MRAFLVVLLVIADLTVFAASKVDKEIEAKKTLAVKLVKAASKQRTSVIEVTSAKRQESKIIVNLTETYETSESGVLCIKSIEFYKDAEDESAEVFKITNGLCFS
ncbi:MAG: hypothetical protein JNL11_08830 [Bdellovibrionaceae bacterium]|nr:hypothetical protein [Pseudobdellovibrionaceae bacterium]